MNNQAKRRRIPTPIVDHAGAIDLLDVFLGSVNARDMATTKAAQRRLKAEFGVNVYLCDKMPTMGGDR